jgi:hypothetical protein
MATNDKEQVIVALEGEINNLKELNELARERGFKTHSRQCHSEKTTSVDFVLPTASRLVPAGHQT